MKTVRPSGSPLTNFQAEINQEIIYEKTVAAPLVNCENGRLRLLNWNIERGYEPDRLSNYIQSIQPDIVCLQEVDWGNERTHNRDVLADLAAATGLTGYFGVEFIELATPLRDKSLAGGGVHGNAILTRFAPSQVYRVELPLMFDWRDPPAGSNESVRRQLRLGARFALCADFPSGDRTLTICSAHLEDNMAGVDGRTEQLTHLVKQIESRRGSNDPVIIAGDLNTLDNWLVRLFNRTSAPPSEVKPWYISEARWFKNKVLPVLGYSDPFSHRAWTYVDSWIYREKLDWLLVKNGEVQATGRDDFNGSDHRPIWADIRL